MTSIEHASASSAQTEAATRAPSIGSGPTHMIGRFGFGAVLVGPADRDREAAQHQQQRDRHDGGVIVAPLHRRARASA